MNKVQANLHVNTMLAVQEYNANVNVHSYNFSVEHFKAGGH